MIRDLTVHHVPAQIDSVAREATLLYRFRRVLDELKPEERFGARDKIAVKMHVGAKDSYTTVHPQFVRALTERFANRDNFLYVVDEHRATRTAGMRGYNQESLGAPVYPISGVVDKYFEERVIKDSPYFTSIKVAGTIAHADGLIVISHAKGHASCGFGGSIKNLGIGCVVQETRNHIHTFEGHEGWRQSVATSGERPSEVLRGRERGLHFSEALARSADEVMQSVAPEKLICLNVAVHIHPYCDCWGLSSPGVFPDIGLFIGSDPASVDAATIQAIGDAPFVGASLPSFLAIAPPEATESGHILERIHGKNPWCQVHALRVLQEVRVIPV